MKDMNGCDGNIQTLRNEETHGKPPFFIAKTDKHAAKNGRNA
jgi:hypothetical protein